MQKIWLLLMALGVVLLTQGSAFGQLSGEPSSGGLWSDLRNFGCVGNGTADDTTCWTNALADAQAKNGKLWCPRGRYKISSTLNLASSTYISGPAQVDGGAPFAGRCEVVASTSAPMFQISGTRWVTIENLVINGGLLSSAGINMPGSVATRIYKNYFTAFASGAAAIKGGGNLYTYIVGNIMDGGVAGYAMDFQNSYASIPANSYYGINVGTIAENLISAGEGAHLGGGIMTVENNDFETTLNSPATAALYFCDPTPNISYVRVTGNYFELTKGTIAKLVAISSCSNSQLEVESNRVNGDSSAGSLAIDAYTTGTPVNAVSSIRAKNNTVQGWATGFDYNGLSGASGSDSEFSGNVFANVTTPYVLAHVAPTSMNTGSVPGSTFSYMPNQGFVASAASILGTVRIAFNGTTIDLSTGNQFRMNGSIAHTLGAVTNAVAGQFFYLHFNTSLTTVTNSVFNLCGGADKLFTAGSTASFLVDSGGIVRQVCNTGVASVFTGSTAVTSTFSATPTFSLADVNVRSPVRFEPAALTANVTAVTFTNKTAGAKYSIAWTQASSGGPFTVAYGASVSAAWTPCQLSTTAGAVTEQFFEVASDGATVIPTNCVTSDTPLLVSGPERAAPSTPIAAFASLWSDSTRHTWTSLNNGSVNQHIMPRCAGTTDQCASTDLSDAANLTTLNGTQTITGVKTFSASPTMVAPTLSNVTGSTQCLHVSTAGLITGTGVDCGTGFANPMTTAGDMIVGGTAGAATRLAAPANGTFCPSWSAGVVTWVTCPGAGGSGLTSVGIAMPTAFTVTNSPLTTNGTITIAGAGTAAQYITGAGALATLNAAAVGLGNVTNNAQTQASVVPNTAPAAGQILVGNTGGTAYAPVTATGCTITSAGVFTCTPTAVGLGAVTNNAQTQAAIVPNTVPASGQLLVGNAGGTAYASVAMSGDATLASSGALVLATINSAPGSCGSATQVCQVTTNGKGLITSQTALTITGLPANSVGLGSVTNNAQTQAAIVPNTTPAAGQILVGNAGGTAYAPVAMSGDATLASTGAITLGVVATTKGGTGLDSSGSTGYGKVASGIWSFAPITAQMGFHFDGGGSALTGTQTSCTRVAPGATITGWYIEGDQAGSATFSVRSVAFASYTGTAGFSGYTDITGGGTAPTITTAASNSSTTLTSWVTAWTGGNIFCAQMTSPSAFNWVNLHLAVNLN